MVHFQFSTFHFQLSLSDTLGLDPNSLAERMRKYFDTASGSSALAASLSSLGQVRIFETIEFN
jgi:hypothetical protein